MANLLLADDNSSLLATMGKILRSEGHQVSSTNSGADALCLMSREPPHDLAILDVNMPGMLSGLDVVRKLMEKPAHPPVVLITGSDHPVPEFPEGAVRRVLRKPFGYTKLLAVVNEALGLVSPSNGSCDEEDCDDCEGCD